VCTHHNAKALRIKDAKSTKSKRALNLDPSHNAFPALNDISARPEEGFKDPVHFLGEPWWQFQDEAGVNGNS
jgi:hypothetical protein